MAETSSRKASRPPAEAPMPTMRTAAATAIFVGGTGRFDGARVAIASFRDMRLRMEASVERTRASEGGSRLVWVRSDQQIRRVLQVTHVAYSFVSDLATNTSIIA